MVYDARTMLLCDGERAVIIGDIKTIPSCAVYVLNKCDASYAAGGGDDDVGDFTQSGVNDREFNSSANKSNAVDTVDGVDVDNGVDDGAGVGVDTDVDDVCDDVDVRLDADADNIPVPVPVPIHVPVFALVYEPLYDDATDENIAFDTLPVPDTHRPIHATTHTNMHTCVHVYACVCTCMYA